MKSAKQSTHDFKEIFIVKESSETGYMLEGRHGAKERILIFVVIMMIITIIIVIIMTTIYSVLTVCQALCQPFPIHDLIGSLSNPIKKSLMLLSV